MTTGVDRVAEHWTGIERANRPRRDRVTGRASRKRVGRIGCETCEARESVGLLGPPRHLLGIGGEQFTGPIGAGPSQEDEAMPLLILERTKQARDAGHIDLCHVVDVSQPRVPEVHHLQQVAHQPRCGHEPALSVGDLDIYPAVRGCHDLCSPVPVGGVVLE